MGKRNAKRGRKRSTPSKAAAPAKPRAPRGPGRPAAADKLFTPEVLLQVEEWWASAVSYTEIARRLGCSWTTVRDHVRRHILPKWREMETCQREALEAQVARMQAVATQKFSESTSPQTRKTIEQGLTKGGVDPRVVRRVLTKISRTGEPQWWSIVQWCIDWKTRVGGHYAAIKVQTTTRSAGMDPKEHHQRMLERLRGRFLNEVGAPASSARTTS